jgi:hypothetical protein
VSDYDPMDPGYTPEPERCPATGGDHVWRIQEQAGTGRQGWACDECHADPPATGRVAP